MRHDELIADAVEAHGGSLIESMGEGDSTVSVFDSAPHAVEAALAATRALAAEPWPPGIRIAVALGHPHRRGRAARRATTSARASTSPRALRAQADGGQIFLSSVTAELVAGAPARGLLARRPRPAPAQGPRRARADPRARGPGRRRAAAGDRVPVPRPARRSRPDDRALLLRPRGGRGRAHRRGSRPAGCSPSSARRAAASPRCCAPASSPPSRAGEVAGIDDAVARDAGRRAGARRARRARAAARRRPVRGAVHAVRRRRPARARSSTRCCALRGAVAIGVRADFYGRLSAHAELAARGRRQPGAARRDDRRRARARDHRAGPARGPAARARPRRADPARRRRRARRAAAALARAARDLGAPRRPHAHRRGLPRQRRRAPRRSPAPPTTSSTRCPTTQRALARSVFLRHDRARRGQRGLPPARGESTSSCRRAPSPDGRRRAARAARRGAPRHARRRLRRGRARGADPRVAAAAPLARRGPRGHPRAPPARRRRAALGRRRPRDRPTSTAAPGSRPRSSSPRPAAPSSTPPSAPSSTPASPRPSASGAPSGGRTAACAGCSPAPPSCSSSRSPPARWPRSAQQRAGRRAAAEAQALTSDAERVGALAQTAPTLEQSMLLRASPRVELEDRVETRGDLLAVLQRNPAAVRDPAAVGRRASPALAVSPDGRLLASGRRERASCASPTCGPGSRSARRCDLRRPRRAAGDARSRRTGGRSRSARGRATARSCTSIDVAHRGSAPDRVLAAGSARSIDVRRPLARVRARRPPPRGRAGDVVADGVRRPSPQRLLLLDAPQRAPAVAARATRSSPASGRRTSCSAATAALITLRPAGRDAGVGRAAGRIVRRYPIGGRFALSPDGRAARPRAQQPVPRRPELRPWRCWTCAPAATASLADRPARGLDRRASPSRATASGSSAARDEGTHVWDVADGRDRRDVRDTCTRRGPPRRRARPPGAGCSTAPATAASASGTRTARGGSGAGSSGPAPKRLRLRTRAR